MAVEAYCIECDWETEMEPTEVPPRCPECGGATQVARDPRDLSESSTKTDKQ